MTKFFIKKLMLTRIKQIASYKSMYMALKIKQTF